MRVCGTCFGARDDNDTGCVCVTGRGFTSATGPVEGCGFILIGGLLFEIGADTEGVGLEEIGADVRGLTSLTGAFGIEATDAATFAVMGAAGTGVGEAFGTGVAEATAAVIATLIPETGA